MSSKEIIERISFLIDKLGFRSRNHFSVVVGIGSSNFSRKMKGEMPFTNPDVFKICSSLGIRKDWLVSGEGDMYDRNEEPRKVTVVQDDFLKQENDFLREMLEMKDETISTLQKCVSLFEKILDMQNTD